MNSADIKLVTELIEQKDADKVKELLVDLHPADIAELCNELECGRMPDSFICLLDNETAADVLVEMDEDARKELPRNASFGDYRQTLCRLYGYG